VVTVAAPGLRNLFAPYPGVTVVAASVFDAAGEAVWSTGTLAPDERLLVQDALDAFSLEPGLSCFERDQQNGRTFVVFPLRCPRGQRRGAAALVLATRTLGGSGREKLLDPALQIILKRLSIAVAAEAGPDEATVVRPVSDALGVSDAPAPSERLPMDEALGCGDARGVAVGDGDFGDDHGNDDEDDNTAGPNPCCAVGITKCL
jgi:hypothetical protein